MFCCMDLLSNRCRFDNGFDSQRNVFGLDIPIALNAFGFAVLVSPIFLISIQNIALSRIKDVESF